MIHFAPFMQNSYFFFLLYYLHAECVVGFPQFFRLITLHRLTGAWYKNLLSAVFLEILRLLQHFCKHIVMRDRGIAEFVKQEDEGDLQIRLYVVPC